MSLTVLKMYDITSLKGLGKWLLTLTLENSVFTRHCKYKHKTICMQIQTLVGKFVSHGIQVSSSKTVCTRVEQISQ